MTAPCEERGDEEVPVAPLPVVLPHDVKYTEAEEPGE